MKITISKSLRRNVSSLTIATALMISPACSTVQDMTETNRSQVVNHISRDSIWLHDSVFVRIRADTVYLEKWHTRWRDRETIKTDTVTNEVVRTETVPVRYIPSFYKYGTALAILLLLLLLAKFVLYLYKRRLRSC